MRLRLSLFGGNLLDLDITIGEKDDPPGQSFGFTGSVNGAVVEISTDRNPMVERDRCAG